MFRTSKAGRMAQGLAAAALIFSLSVTTFAGSANAAPLADCSEAAHARNDATHLLHSAWKVFNGDLKDLSNEAKKLNKESRKDKSSTVMTTDAREEVASATQELKSIRSQAHADIQAEIELGTACDDEDTTTTTTTTSVAAPSDATAPADSTGSAHTFDTSGLDEKYKDIVEQAIEDMQAVVDEATKAVMDMAAAAETTETADDTEVTTEVKSAKAEREKAKEVREEAKAEAKGKSKDKSEATSTDSGKTKGNGKAQNRK